MKNPQNTSFNKSVTRGSKYCNDRRVAALYPAAFVCEDPWSAPKLVQTS